MNSSHRRVSPLLFYFLAAWILLCTGASAQSSGVTARIASVAGPVTLSVGEGAPPFALARGHALNTGNRVDTRGGGRAVIDLSDGSVVVVQPETILMIKDFRAAASLRELFEIALGAVRVKINHFSGKPNPYRMNSPTASIAVRGTEFDVIVGPEGETTVDVYDGAVEVGSLSEPGTATLIEAGRGVLVRPGQAFQVYGLPIARDITPVKGSPPHVSAGMQKPPAPRGEYERNPFGETSPSAETAVIKSRREPKSPPPVVAATDDTPSTFTTTSAYDRYLATLTDVGHLPYVFRFTALSDTYLDSLENPAYASSVRSPEAHLFIVPTRSRTASLYNGAAESVPSSASEFGVSPQAAYFQPILRNRVVLGASLGSWHVSRNGSGETSTSSSDTNVFSSLGVFSALAFGPQNKYSIGLKLERIAGRGEASAETSTIGVGRQNIFEQIASESSVLHTRLTVGYAGPVSDHHTLGVFVRYGIIEANKGDQSHILNGRPLTLDATDSEGRSREAGIRLRGSLTRRLSYGVVGTLSTVTLTDGLERAATVDSSQRGHVRRAAFGIGLSRLIAESTMLSIDASGGTSNITASRREDDTGALLQSGRFHARFFSVNAAVHRDLTTKLFVSGSILRIWRSDSVASALYPDRFGRLMLLTDSFLPATPYAQANRYSEFGGGWRLSRSVTAQYLYGTDFGLSSGGHVVVLRYTFRPARD